MLKHEWMRILPNSGVENGERLNSCICIYRKDKAMNFAESIESIDAILLLKCSAFLSFDIVLGGL